MQITTNVTFNLQTPDYSVIYEPQGNNLSRFIHVQLMDGSTPWTVPANTLMVIRYRKPDGTFGMYDSNEKGEPAFSFSGSTVDVELVSQMLTVAGDVAAQLDFYNTRGQHLSTFSFRVAVEESPITDGEIESSDYFNVLTATLAEAEQIWVQIKDAYGAPRTASTAAAMADKSFIYVYVGTTTSALTNGHWYFWNGSAWTDGGLYNSTAFQTPLPVTLGGTGADNPSGAATNIIGRLAQVSVPIETTDRVPFIRSVGDYVRVKSAPAFSQDMWNLLNKDSEPIEDSEAPITSGAVYQALGGIFSPVKYATPGPLVHIEDGGYNQPIQGMKIAINPVQSGEGDPSPDNVRPISGWAAAKITRTGMNLLPFPYVGTVTGPGTYSFSGVTVTVNSDGTMLLNGTASANIYMNLTFDSITAVPVPPVGTLLTIGCEGLVPGITFINGIFTSPDFSTRRGFANLTDVRPIVSGLEIADGDYYFRSYIQINNGTVCNNVLIKPFFALGNTPDATFEQYKGEVYEVSFSSAGTVYGGYLTYNGDGTWTLTVDHYTMTVTGADITATINLGDVIRANLVYVESGKNATGRNALAISNWLPRIAANYSGNAMGFYFDTESRVYIKAPNNAIGITSETSVGDRLALTKAYFDANPLLIVYPLATALSFTLTGPEVMSLLGVNNVWADCGEIEELAYRADIGLYLVEALNPIKEMLAYREDTMKATRAYTTGDYIVVGDTFFKVTVPIANGATLTPGTNVTATTVGAQLKLLS